MVTLLSFFKKLSDDGEGGDDIWVPVRRETLTGFSTPRGTGCHVPGLGQMAPPRSSPPWDRHSGLCREQTFLLASVSPVLLRPSPFSISQFHPFLESESLPENPSILQATSLARQLDGTEALRTGTTGVKVPLPLDVLKGLEGPGGTTQWGQGRLGCA